MRLTNGVTMLEIPTLIMGSPGIIYPTLIMDKENVILVDAGFPGQITQLRQAFEKEGVAFYRLTKVILTHHDIDHIGGLVGILKELPGQITILSHSEETAYVQGDKPPLKLAQLEANLNSMTDESRSFYNKFKTAFLNAYTEVDQSVSDGELLPYCGGIIVIYTPGHTLGHISLYIKESKILVAGDALCIEEGVLVKTRASTNFDADLYQKSLEKLGKIDIQKIICYHGGLYQKKVNQRIEALASVK